jgi:hypothetical protein
MRLLVKLPSRQRPAKLLSVLHKYIDFAANKQDIVFLISLDSDDPTLTNEVVGHLKSMHPNVDVRIGTSQNKIDAINRDMDTAPPFDIVLLASDDMIPMVRGYDNVIRAKMSQHYPDTDGVLWFNDGYAGQKLNTLVCCGRAYFQRFGFLYNPAYKSFYCDNEFMDAANALGKQTYFPDVIIKHLHPANTADVKNDALYIRNNVHYYDDADTYYTRKQYPFDISILICTLPERRVIFSRILTILTKQVNLSSLKIEIVSDARDRKTSVGTKRQDLLNRAKGRYCCFVDDDDVVSDDYIAIYETMFQTGTFPDCVSLHGLLYANGLPGRHFYHSLKYKEWREDEKGYYRSPNHLNLIKTWIAKEIGFHNKTYGEDHDFSKRLLESGLLRTEYEHIGDVQYHYYYVNPTSTQIPTMLAGQDSVELKGRLQVPGPARPISIIQQRKQAHDQYKASSGLKYLI